MKSIFENLENLNVSEECFEDIVNIVEEHINELLDMLNPQKREEKAIEKAAAEAHKKEIETMKRQGEYNRVARENNIKIPPILAPKISGDWRNPDRQKDALALNHPDAV